MRSTFMPRMPGSVLRVAFVLLLASWSPGEAQTNDPPVQDLRADPVAGVAARMGNIEIDGRIEETAWQAAPLINGFVQSEPVEGEPATRDTEVRILLDEDAIYVAARILDDPDQVVRVLNRRDERGGFFDWVGISFDPNLTRRNAYHFRVNAAGVLGGAELAHRHNLLVRGNRGRATLRAQMLPPPHYRGRDCQLPCQLRKRQLLAYDPSDLLLLELRGKEAATIRSPTMCFHPTTLR